MATRAATARAIFVFIVVVHLCNSRRFLCAFWRARVAVRHSAAHTNTPHKNNGRQRRPHKQQAPPFGGAQNGRSSSSGPKTTTPTQSGARQTPEKLRTICTSSVVVGWIQLFNGAKYTQKANESERAFWPKPLDAFWCWGGKK